MVCDRCIMAVKNTLSEMNIPFSEVILGEAVLETEEENIDFDLLGHKLNKIGFELVKDRESAIVERIKSLVINYIHYNDDDQLKVNFSGYLAAETGKDYTYLSRLFSQSENITVEKFIILQRVERVKELISYGELNFSEIAYKLNYSSVSHLSKQFKTITGFTLSEYKNRELKKRKPLDKV